MVVVAAAAAALGVWCCGRDAEDIVLVD